MDGNLRNGDRPTDILDLSVEICIRTEFKIQAANNRQKKRPGRQKGKARKTMATTKTQRKGSFFEETKWHPRDENAFLSLTNKNQASFLQGDNPRK